MRTTRTLLLALGTLAASLLVAPAAAGPPADGPTGYTCHFLSTADPGTGDQVGEVTGGPMIWDRDFYLHCHLKVDHWTHSGPERADVHRPSFPHDGDVTPGEVAAFVAPVRYPLGDDEIAVSCTAVSWPHSTGPNWLYWHPAGSAPGHWTTEPTSPCFEFGPDPEPLPDTVFRIVDGALCPVLAGRHEHPSAPGPGDRYYVDHEGDVFVDDGGGISEARWRETFLWDCPPYSSFSGPGPDGDPVIDP